MAAYLTPGCVGRGGQIGILEFVWRSLLHLCMMTYQEIFKAYVLVADMSKYMPLLYQEYMLQGSGRLNTQKQGGGGVGGGVRPPVFCADKPEPWSTYSWHRTAIFSTNKKPKLKIYSMKIRHAHHVGRVLDSLKNPPDPFGVILIFPGAGKIRISKLSVAFPRKTFWGGDRTRGHQGGWPPQ